MYSPDGYHSPVLEHVTFRLVSSNDTWKVDRFAALHENIRLRGSFDFDFMEDGAKALDIDMAINSFYTKRHIISTEGTNQLLSDAHRYI